MASIRRQKEALRIAVLAFVAGAHYVTEEVEKSQSLSVAGSSEEAIEARHAMLEADFARVCESAQAVEMLADMLDEEDLYPYGSAWPREALIALIQKVIAPVLSFTTKEGESDLKFGYKKGFKALLADFSENIDGIKTHVSTLDHWMVLLLNAAFYAGVNAASRNAENSKAYYQVIPEIDEETEPWCRYGRLADLLDRQLRRETRRRTGLVSDLDYE